MTNDEAIDLLSEITMYCDFTDQYGDYINDEPYITAVEMAIKALEQQPILDKIRAEIEQNAYPIVHGINNHEKGMTLYGILQIIDKYKAESQESEE